MTQIEFFKTTQTDNLLRMRFMKTCYYPQKEGDKPDFSCYDNGKYMWYINKEYLYEELATRPHRIRAKQRRKNKLWNEMK